MSRSEMMPAIRRSAPRMRAAPMRLLGEEPHGVSETGAGFDADYLAALAARMVLTVIVASLASPRMAARTDGAGRQTCEGYVLVGAEFRRALLNRRIKFDPSSAACAGCGAASSLAWGRPQRPALTLSVSNHKNTAATWCMSRFGRSSADQKEARSLIKPHRRRIFVVLRASARLGLGSYRGAGHRIESIEQQQSGEEAADMRLPRDFLTAPPPIGTCPDRTARSARSTRARKIRNRGLRSVASNDEAGTR